MDETNLVPVEPPAPSAPAVRNQKGQFAVQGCPPEMAQRKASLTAVGRVLKTELADYLAQDPVNRNPLLILAKIAADPDELSSLRVNAADRLARYLAPRLMNIELETPDVQFDVETTRMRVTLRAALGLPAGE